MTSTALRNAELRVLITQELQLLWLAHGRLGLSGFMQLYSEMESRPWPAAKPGLSLWFGPEEIEGAVAFVLEHYREGLFPHTALLLNPIVHARNADGSYTALGSGIVWASALGGHTLAADKKQRLLANGFTVAEVARGDFPGSGLKIVGFSDTVLAPQPDRMVIGGAAAYALADVDGAAFTPYYLLSGLTYTSSFGAYRAEALASAKGVLLLTSGAEIMAALEAHTVPENRLQDAAQCWEEYDRKPPLYARFGNDVAGLQDNLKFYYYCARDFSLFDAVGPHAVKQESGGEGGFDFLVHGLIPRGSIILLAGTGGTGKSSLAHKLCCLVATDWKEGEEPRWLGQKINVPRTKGICVYFAGEDGPAILNARNEIFDPEARAQRLMFQRTNFTDADGGKLKFAEFLERLRAMPEVPLMVIDPARKYLTGDEDDAAVVSHFFEAIEQFAHERNTAVIVVHHLSKGAKPQSAREVLDELRGSQVFIDRPRVVIGMFREGPKTVVGLAKCNIPPSLGMVIEERVFAHNPKTLDLIQLPGKEGVRDPYHVPEMGEE